MKGQVLILKAKELMRRQTVKNGAPAWALTELAVKKGFILSKKHKVRSDLVIAALYLAHTVFSKVIKGRIQKKHTVLSAFYVEPILKKWGVSKSDRIIIINSIKAHHGKEPTLSLIAEVVKNAECFKFITVEGFLIELHELGRRGLSLAQAIDFAEYKMKQKLSYLTLKDCQKEAKLNVKQIRKLLNQVRSHG
ncbi:hypothetical protein KKC17_00740 [Patescibacteria group bacterium]|nr:hypothetical protein [Patescibacteria group bacterium]